MTADSPGPRRLIIVVLNFPVPEDRRVWLEAQAAVAAGHEVAVICPALRGHRPGRVHLDGVDIHYVEAFEGKSALGVVAEAAVGAARAMRAARRLGLRGGDVLQVCTPPDTLAPLLRSAARRGVACVYDQHDVVPLLAATKRAQRPLVPLHLLLERATVRSSSAVITAGDAQAERISDRYGVTPTVVRTAAADTELRHAPRPRPDILGYLGVMGSQDGVDRLVRAVRELHDRGRPDIRVRLAGDGPELPRLESLVRELDLSKSVEFCGWVKASELDRFLTTVDCLVVPDPLTAFNQTCPMLKVTHALAQGLPVVMTPLEENLSITGGLGYVAAGDEPGQLADAVQAFLESSENERVELVSALRSRYDEVLAWPAHRDRYLEVIAQASVSARS